jgi:glucosamine--fructose-6-phosphate aminotransferase (isomerizing)
MCGIIGYIGNKNCTEILLSGLKLMEYRGYDSSGIVLVNNNKLNIYKEKGKIKVLEALISSNGKKSAATVGIGHTRWATHGEPSKLNAHPHANETETIALIHNGIIENYHAIKQRLSKEGYNFKTQTDTEVLVHLIDKCYTGDPLKAVSQALKLVEGTYGICVVFKDHPDIIIGARKGSPLMIGVSDEGMFLASDAAAFRAFTSKAIYLEDGDIAVITKENYATYDIDTQIIEKKIEEIEWDLQQIQKSGYAHFMLKEICEQPFTIENAYRGRILTEEGMAKLGGLNLTEHEIRKIKRIILCACGTSYYSGLVGEYMLEEYARIPVEVEYASEFRYRNPIINEHDLMIVISQSGETADTLAALREAKEKGAKVLGITNVVGSTIARESDGGIYIHAGPEIGVASTKAFTSQITVLALLTLAFGRKKAIGADEGREITTALKELPSLVNEIISNHEDIKDLAELFYEKRNFLYLGRGLQFPIALEGALKLKEISYIHAEGYPAAEMKHGPIALIDENMPVVVIAIKDPVYDKVISTIEEVKARKGIVIAIATKGDKRISKLADHVIYVPQTHKLLMPILSVIPLQLLAYYIAVKRGCHIDQPRNLAKSVTVE